VPFHLCANLTQYETGDELINVRFSDDSECHYMETCCHEDDVIKEEENWIGGDSSTETTDAPYYQHEIEEETTVRPYLKPHMTGRPRFNQEIEEETTDAPYVPPRSTRRPFRKPIQTVFVQPPTTTRASIRINAAANRKPLNPVRFLTDFA